MYPELNEGARSRPRRRSSAKRLLRGVLVAVSATFMLAAGASSASAAPSVELTHDWDLGNTPEVTVEGTGFVSPTPVLNPGLNQMGLYAAQMAIVDGEFVVGEGDAQQWIRPVGFGGAGPTLLNMDGTFTTELTVSQEIGAGPSAVDCAEVQCYIATWQAHGNPVAGQLFTQTPIYFAPTLNVDPATDIDPEGTTTLAISGGGLDPDTNGGNGFYVALTAVVGTEVRYTGAQWIRPATAMPPGAGNELLADDGTFATTLDVAATFMWGEEEVRCELYGCAIRIWPAHTDPEVGAGSNIILTTPIKFAFTYNPSLNASPSSDLGASADLAVSGSGFPPGAPGFYVSLAAIVNGAIVTPPAGPGGGTPATRYIRPNASDEADRLNPDGSFATSLTVTRKFTTSGGNEIDCAAATCVIATWKAHTNPAVATLYTSTPLAFKGDSVAPGASKPPVVNVAKTKRFRVGPKGKTIKVAALVCKSETCTVKKPKRAVLKIGKKKYGLKVGGPAKLKQGKRGFIRLRVPAKVAKKLTGRKGRVKFVVVIRSEAGIKKVTINKVLVGPKGKRK